MTVVIFLPIPAPIVDNIPLSESPIAASKTPPVATPPAIPKSKIPFLTADLPKSPKRPSKLPLATSAPNVLD